MASHRRSPLTASHTTGLAVTGRRGDEVPQPNSGNLRVAGWSVDGRGSVRRSAGARVMVGHQHRVTSVEQRGFIRGDGSWLVTKQLNPWHLFYAG
jgi:hypothetical protein